MSKSKTFEIQKMLEIFRRLWGKSPSPHIKRHQAVREPPRATEPVTVLLV